MAHPLSTALTRAEQKTETSLTDAQRASGKYTKGTLDWKGLKIAVETPKGEIRTGTGKDGKRWFVEMPATYGELLRTEGRDGDPVDVYLGNDHASRKVFVVDQKNAESGRFDEHKCFLGFPDKRAVTATYEKAFSDGKARDRLGEITELSVEDFKHWLKAGDTKQPMSNQKPNREQALIQAYAPKGYATGGRVGYEDGGAAGEVVRDLERGVLPRNYKRVRANRALAGQEMRPMEADRYAEYTAHEPEIRNRRMEAFDEGAILGRAGEVGNAFLRNIAPPIPGYNVPSQEEWMAANLARINKRDAEGTSALGDFAREELPGAVAGVVAPGAGRLVGRAFSAAPKTATAALAGLGSALGYGTFAGAAEPQNQPARPDPQAIIQDLHRQRSMIEQRRTDADTELQKARAEMKRQEKTGRGPLYEGAADRLAAAEAKYKALSADLSSVTAMLTSETEKTTPEYRRKQEELDRKAREDAVKAEANKTFREAHPYWNAALPALGLAGAVGLPYLGKAVAQSVRNTPINRLNDMVTATDAAIAAKNAAKISDLTPRLKAYKSDLEGGKISADPTAKSETLGFLGSGLGGGVIGAEARMFPTQYDAAALPDDNPLKEEARKRQFNPLLYAEGMIPGAATAMGSYWKLPVRKAVPQSQDIEGILKKYGTTPESAGRALTRSEMSTPTSALRPVEELTALRPTIPNERRLAGPTATDAEIVAPPTPSRSLPPLVSAPSPEPAALDPRIIIKTKDSRGRTHHREEDGKFTPYPKKETLKKDKPDSKPTPPEDERARGGIVARTMALARRYATGGKVAVGGIPGDSGGREDALPVSVANGSFVVPADCVSSFGTGNTEAGIKKLTEMFGAPRGDYAAGGAVPIRISAGEFVITPEQVAQIGNGSMDAGHKALDAWVQKSRAEHIRTLQSLPPPAKS